MDLKELNNRLAKIGDGKFTADVAQDDNVKASLNGSFLSFDRTKKGQVVFCYDNDKIATVETKDGNKFINFSQELAYFDSYGAKMMSEFMAIVADYLGEEN